MSTLAIRRHRENLRRKGAIDAQLVFESEIGVPLKHKEQMPEPPSSPDMIFAQHDILPQPEVMLLPGAWTVVGKNGRPLKQHELKMYDEPKRRKSKKKNKKKSRKEVDEEDNPLLDLDEAPSTSKCVQMLERSVAQRAKDVSQGLDKKYWVRYQRSKRVTARKNALFAAAVEKISMAAAAAAADDDDSDGDNGSDWMMHDPLLSPPRNFNKLAQKKRRAARLGSAAARCYSPDDEAEWLAVAVEAEPLASPSSPSSRAKKIAHAPRAKVAKPRKETVKASTATERDDATGSADKRKADNATKSRKSSKKQAAASKGNTSSCTCS